VYEGATKFEFKLKFEFGKKEKIKEKKVKRKRKGGSWLGLGTISAQVDVTPRAAQCGGRH
jgi:hypothetical protein